MSTSETMEGIGLTPALLARVRREPSAEPAEPDRRDAPGGLGRWLLRAPLFYKILVANALLIIVVAVTTAEFVRRYHEAADALVIGGVIAVGVLASVAANGLIVRLALAPLRRLERTAERVQLGDLEARAEISPLADRDLRRVARTFNAMLESGASYRRRLRDMSARATRAAEEERKRVARELHDGTAQTLAALRVRLRLVRGTPDCEAMAEGIERVSAELGEAIEEVRRMARGLRPPALDMLGLATAAQSLAESVGDTAGIEVTVDAADLNNVLSPDRELTLYRVLQEALSNVVHHSGAGRVEVRLERRGRQVELSVRDDGRGFSVEEAMAEGRGLGLFGMQERAAYVGGRVALTSVPGEGTTVTVTIPISETSYA